MAGDKATFLQTEINYLIQKPKRQSDQARIWHPNLGKVFVCYTGLSESQPNYSLIKTTASYTFMDTRATESAVAAPGLRSVNIS